MAVGNLLLDVDVSDEFDCSYSLSGSLLGQSAEGDFELSVLGLEPEEPIADAAFREVLSRGGAISTARPDVSLHHDGAATTFAGFGNHLLITTHEPSLAAVVAAVCETVGEAHDPFGPPEGRIQTRPLRGSHLPWFAQRRESLRAAIGWHAELPDAARQLDEFWASLVDEPPDDQHQLETMISCAAVGFGELLRPMGFEWSIVRDEWGTNLGMVALEATAKIVVVPDSFVGKRWERGVRTFIEDVLPSLREQVEKASR